MRQINLSKSSANKNLIVYDTSGVYTDNDICQNIDLNKGLPKIRENWIKERNDVEEYIGRNIKPEDNGILNNINAKAAVPAFDLSNFKPLRAKKVKDQHKCHMLKLELSQKKWNILQFVKIWGVKKLVMKFVKIIHILQNLIKNTSIHHSGIC